MAGFGLGLSTLNMCCLGFLYGINIPVDTLVSQAFGAMKYELCQTILVRARIVNFITYLITVPILLNSKEILVAIGQNADVAEQAQIFLIWALPGLLLEGQIDA